MCKRKSWMSKVKVGEWQVCQGNGGRQEKLDPSLCSSLVPMGSWVAFWHRMALLFWHLGNSLPSHYLPLCQETCLQPMSHRARASRLGQLWGQQC